MCCLQAFKKTLCSRMPIRSLLFAPWASEICICTQGFWCKQCVQNAHVPENQRADAANSLVYEANARLRDPVYGSTGTIYSLQHQAQVLRVELNAMKAEILKYKCTDPMSQPPMLGVYNVNSDDCKVNNPTASTVNAADYTVKQRYYSIINHNRWGSADNLPVCYSIFSNKRTKVLWAYIPWLPNHSCEVRFHELCDFLFIK